VLVQDVNSATHLYYIAQEAVNNAIKHGQARRILVALSAGEGEGTLVVEDDGRGILNSAAGHSGMGLRIMSYRANMIGGGSEIERNAEGGTTVTVRFPLRNSE
jgi:two-component system sensor kinase FixL